MPIVQAYQCAFTGALFADRADYCAHVKEVGLERGREKRIEKLERFSEPRDGIEAAR